MAELKVKNIEIVLRWEMKCDTTICNICKNDLLFPSTKYLSESSDKYLVIDAKLKQGQCMHIFHHDCIESLLDSGNINCPSCPSCSSGEKWTIRNNLDSSLH